MKQRIVATVAGIGASAGAAFWPLVALAKEPDQVEAASRALSAPHDLSSIVVVTLLALAGVFIVAGIGFLYRRERHLDWQFQRPDAPQEEHH